MSSVKLITQLTSPDSGGTWTLTSAPVDPVTIKINGQTHQVAIGGTLIGPYDLIVDFTNSPFGIYEFNYQLTSECSTADSTVTVDYSACTLGCPEIGPVLSIGEIGPVCADCNTLQEAQNRQLDILWEVRRPDGSLWPDYSTLTWSVTPTTGILNLGEQNMKVDISAFLGDKEFTFTVTDPDGCDSSATLEIIKDGSLCGETPMTEINICNDSDTPVNPDPVAEEHCAEICNNIGSYDLFVGVDIVSPNFNENTYSWTQLEGNFISRNDNIIYDFITKTGEYTFSLDIADKTNGLVYQTRELKLVIIDCLNCKAGQFIAQDPVCNTSPTTVNLFDFIEGYQAGGTWSQTMGSTVDISNPQAVDFSGKLAGTYKFLYKHSDETCFAEITIQLKSTLSAGGAGTVSICPTILS